MNRYYRLIIFVCLFGIKFLCFADENDSRKLYFQPIASYKVISFENITFHNPMVGLSLIRLDPVSKNMFSVATMYSSNITDGIENSYPDMYHNVILALNGKIGRHSLLGSFVANTDKPLYGGLHTFNAFAGYTYDLIKGQHFSMNLGGYLMLMDIGVNLENGTPWLLWPIPFLSLKWDYEWIDVSVLPGITVTIADKKPVSFTISRKSQDFDIALWYHHFRNKKPSAEILGIGIGLKNTSSDITTANGEVYGINYWALYGGVTIFKLIEINGGWAFNGKEKYDKKDWSSLFETYGHSNDLNYNRDIGNGFFFSVSAKFIF